jgi:hypothetical protein
VLGNIIRTSRRREGGEVLGNIVRTSNSRGKEGKSEGTLFEQAEAERRRGRVREHC